MINRIRLKLNWYFRNLLTAIGMKRRYSIEGIHIGLDYTHHLPDFQRSHPNYDRFLPHIVQYLPEHSVVIDVGANVGDSLVGMAGKNSELEYVCIEADRIFVKELTKNVESLLSQKPNLIIHTVHQFIGLDVDNVSLSGSGGTKHAEFGGEIKSKSLSKTLDELGINQNKVSLIKTDVDGFDYDVIRSSYDMLTQMPYIYFECQYDNEDQLSGYRAVFRELKDKGYAGFAMFDNFGQYICSVNSISEIDDLLSYVARQNFTRSTRTIYYYDVLAFSERFAEQTTLIINEYNK